VRGVLRVAMNKYYTKRTYVSSDLVPLRALIRDESDQNLESKELIRKILD
jgi:hypothetical protein